MKKSLAIAIKMTIGTKTEGAIRIATEIGIARMVKIIIIKIKKQTI